MKTVMGSCSGARSGHFAFDWDQKPQRMEMLPAFPKAQTAEVFRDQAREEKWDTFGTLIKSLVNILLVMDFQIRYKTPLLYSY